MQYCSVKSSPPAIWRSVFQILYPSEICYDVLISITSEAWLDDFPSADDVRVLASENLSPIRTRQTPIKANGRTAAAPPDIYTEVDPQVRAELKGRTFRNTVGFINVFFQPYQPRAAEMLQLPQFPNQMFGTGESKFPQTANPGPVEKRLLGLANQVLSINDLNRRYAASESKALDWSNLIPEARSHSPSISIGGGEFQVVLHPSCWRVEEGPGQGVRWATNVQPPNYVNIMFAFRTHSSLYPCITTVWRSYTILGLRSRQCHGWR